MRRYPLDIRARNVGIFPDWLSWVVVVVEKGKPVVGLFPYQVVRSGRRGKGQGLDLAPHHHPFLLERDILFICRDEPILRGDLIINHGVDVVDGMYQFVPYAGSLGPYEYPVRVQRLYGSRKVCSRGRV
jgi:hypothetical protein